MTVLETISALQLNNSKLIRQIRELQSEITLDIVFYKNDYMWDDLLNINEILIKLVQINCEHINRLFDIYKL